MQTSFISSRSLQNAPRLSISDLQSDLSRATREVSTGRLADPGLVLGAAVTRSVDLRIEETFASRLMRSNAIADARLDQTQRVLEDVRTRANAVLESVTALPPSTMAVEALVNEAGGALAELIGKLNGSDGTNFLFAGINAGVRPVAEYDASPRLAVEAAITSTFGTVPIPPGTPPAAMAAFLSGDLAAVFDPAGWSADWSSASDTPLSSEIERGRVIATSRIGLAQQSVGSATSRLADERDVLFTALRQVEGRDPVEAKTEIDMLTLQLEMSYALTVRVSGLSLLGFAR
jgi:flagellar hook-associated protein 3 FlgL